MQCSNLEKSMLDQTPTPVAQRTTKPPRDVRLDFFRGVGMFIIFIAHVPDNPWALLIPARFGFSDATEMFVFCSGMASALAFGAVFETRGFALGVARIAHRCWQVYWTHIGLFLTVATCMVLVDRALGTGNAYVNGIELGSFFAAGPAGLADLMTLTYVPHYFDILPMYLVILAMIPIVVALEQVSRPLAMAAVVAVWGFAALRILELPAGSAGTEQWYFNPFSWQLVFFTGFAFMKGWLPPPPVTRPLILAALAFLVISVPLSWYPGLEASPELTAARNTLLPLLDKSHEGLLRFAHFLCLAYLANIAAGDRGNRLKGPLVDLCREVGQQALAVFLAGMTLSFLAGVALNLTGRSLLAVALVNIAGMALMLATARLVGWFKSTPWKSARRTAS